MCNRSRLENSGLSEQPEPYMSASKPVMSANVLQWQGIFVGRRGDRNVSGHIIYSGRLQATT